MGTGTPKAHSISLLVKGAGARTLLTARGNFILDVLARSRQDHYNLFNAAFWTQETLQCYTPQPRFYAAHSLLADQDAAYPVPNTTGSPYSKVTWAKVAGQNSVRSLLPDGEPAAAHLKIMDDGPAGSTWAVQTVDLGNWSGDFGAALPGAFGLNRGVVVTVRRLDNDGAPADAYELADPTSNGETQAENIGRPGDIRVNVGNLWSVKLPGDGSAATFEKKIARAANGGLLWERLHTFTETPADGTWYVAFGVVAGRLFVNVVGKNVCDTAFVYTERTGKLGPALKDLTIPAAPVTVSGQSGGGACYIGLRRIGYTEAQFTNTMDVSDAIVTGDINAAPVEGSLTSIRHTPVPNGDVYLTSKMLSATTMEYTATVTATSDGREPAACKWVLFSSTRRSTPNSATTIDYGLAVRRYSLHLPEPDFNGTGGTRGSDAFCELEFDTYLLDQIAAAHGSDWRTDLGPYGLATVTTSRVLQDAAGNVTTDTGTRLVGVFEDWDIQTEGFQQTTLTLTLRDPMVLLKDPAGFVDTTYRPLELLFPQGVDYVYGYHAVQYILSMAISPDVGAALQVHMPASWYPLSLLKISTLVDGKLPPNDTPILNPPYGKFAAEWLKDVATFDFAALFWNQGVPIYGQFDLCAASLPNHALYAGESGGGTPQDLTRDQMAWSLTKLGRRVRTSKDYNDWVVYGQPLGGIGGANTVEIGVPVVQARSTDFGRAQATYQRTKLFDGAMFYDPESAKQFVRAVKTFSGQGKAAIDYEATAPFGQPGLGWGHTVTISGGHEAQADGKTFRIYELTETGDMDGQTVRTVMKLTENLT